MLIPAVLLYVMISVTLITVSGTRRNITALAVLAVLMWLSSFLSAFFAGWAWAERSYSENWAMYGVFLISAPVIASNAVLAIAGIAVTSVRRIEKRKWVCRSLYLLLLFLAAQVMVCVWAA